MGRGNSVQIGLCSFASNKAATEYFRSILRRYQPGDRVDAVDEVDLRNLILRHPEHLTKIGCGIDHFEVMDAGLMDGGAGTQCFRVVRTDGSGTDFSYLTCIKGRPPSRKREVSEALRLAVRADIIEARDRFFADHRSADGLYTRARTRERIKPDDGHMDHVPPLTFEVIVLSFLAHRGITADDVPITDGRDNQACAEITDEVFTEQFREYHRRIANLDFVKAGANLAQSARHRVRPGRISAQPARRTSC